MRHQKLTKRDIKFLIKNYSTLGPKECAKKLNHKSWMYLSKVAQKLQLKRNKDLMNKSKSWNQVKMKPFNNITSPYICYILGFIWADGYVSSTKNRVAVSFNIKDLTDLKPILLKHIPFHIHFAKRNGQPGFSINDLSLRSFLKENDYLIKSLATPSKILSKIPKSLQHYFFRGYFDGDGCFTNITTCPTINFVGSYNQNWNDIFNIIKNITNHQPKILRRNDDKRGHKSSVIYFYGKDRIKKFLDYLYKGESIGLSRKRERYEKFTSLLS